MIYCVEDDGSIRDLEVYTLNNTGFEAKGFHDGNSFWEALKNARPELIILDIMLPGEDGCEILKKLKSSNTTEDIPVIMATAKGMEFDKVQSLDMGADDYLVKPFGMMEMVSRVKAVLRRCKKQSREEILQAGNLKLDVIKRTAQIGEENIVLTFKEFELLKLFMSNPEIALTREHISDDVWGSDFVGESRTVDVHVRTLRQKIGDYGNCIETVRNIGYRWAFKRKERNFAE